jgi:UDPglucose--hexose-1-phosphate uridylyltransferase
MTHLSPEEILEIIRTWKTEYETIGSMEHISYVQIFENKGQLMGASSPHPHGQIWANEHLPSIVENEQHHQQNYFTEHSSPLLLEYLHMETEKQERLILENESFAVVVPFWATWPYETMVLPKTYIRSLSDMNEDDMKHLSEILKRLTARYDKIFSTSFPYSMGIHQQPTDGSDHPEWQFHMHFYPPLLRSSTIKKYYVGYEMLAEPQRDITPESAAMTLKEIHD